MMKPLTRHPSWFVFPPIVFFLGAAAVGGDSRPRARAITADEVRAAIVHALAARGITPRAVTANGRLSIAIPSVTTRDDAMLEVVDIRCDPFFKRTLARLRVAGEPQVLPFLATAEGCPAALTRPRQGPYRAARVEGNGHAGTDGSDHPVSERGDGREMAAPAQDIAPLSRAVNRRAPDHRALAEPGKPARLVLEGAGFRISTRVMPLERGAHGQRIRVRALDSRRVMKAQVTGPGLVQMVD